MQGERLILAKGFIVGGKLSVSCLFPVGLLVLVVLRPHLTQKPSPITFRNGPPLFESFQNHNDSRRGKEGTDSCA